MCVARATRHFTHLRPAIKHGLQQLYSLGLQLTDPRRWPRLPSELTSYARDLRWWREQRAQSDLNGPINVEPILFQKTLNSPYDAHYTYQSAWATRHIVAAAPERHVDVSSSVPFVVQLAAVLPVTMYEFHKPDVSFPGLTLCEGTVVGLPMPDQSVASLSCLHVIEHVGLGRYGDPLDADGARKGLVELARVVARDGALYLSVPSGDARVAFNAHRVLDPNAVAGVMNAQGLTLKSFSFVDDNGRFWDECEMSRARGEHYGCGMFRFTR